MSKPNETSFKALPDNPNFADLEKEVLAFWEQEQIFQKSLEKNQAGKKYIIYDGPPTANAKPPLHTLVPMAFKDAIGRYKTMQGYNVPRQAGWDTHGLPVEVQMEKALGYSSKKEILNSVPGDEYASIAKFNAACKESVWNYKQEWDRFVPRVGYFIDTQKPYITYEPQFIEKVWGVFKRIWEMDLVYKGYKVLPYCPRCETGLSAAEVAQEYADVKDVSVYVTFPLVNNPKRSFIAWTTTPWTLPGNVGLALGEKITYVVVEQKTPTGETHEYILAKERLSILKGDFVILEEYMGKELAGLEYQPLFTGVMDGAPGRRYLSVLADFVTTTDGSGIVHTACMYGVDDFELGQKEGLTMEHTVDPQGHFLPRVKEFAGIYVKDALVPILKYLDGTGRLYAKETITHSYPFCWRCHTALLYYAKDSWYIAMSKKRQELIKANQAIEWIPEHIKSGRFGDFVKEARDWAVSRERFWGTPMPVWTAPSGKHICVGSFSELKSFAKNPDLIGPDFDPHRPTIDQVVLVKDDEEYVFEPFVLDCWFDSGSMPYASGRYEQGEFPADYIAEAIDQTRGWFYTLLAESALLDQKSSYKRVVCIGHLVDEQGKKMSKSLGNIFDPWEMFDKYGVDPIRWFIYTTNSPGESKAFGPKELALTFRKSSLLLWNVFNYFVTYANLHGYKPDQDSFQAGQFVLNKIDQNALTELDRWILSLQDQTIQQVTEYFEAYDLMRAGRALELYLNELSTWYLRRNRKREDLPFFQIMHHLLIRLSQMIAPLAPFLPEYVYQTLQVPGAPISVHLTEWPRALGRVDHDLEVQMKQLRQAVELGLSLRMDAKQKVRQPLACAWINYEGSQPTQTLLDILLDELNVEKVIWGEPEAGIPIKSDFGVTVGLDPNLTSELIEKGEARELMRQLQQHRKQSGLNPGQMAKLRIGPTHRSRIENLLKLMPTILKDSFLVVDEQTWKIEGQSELALGDETIPVSLESVL